MKRHILLIDVPVVPVVLHGQAKYYVRRKLLLEASIRKSLLPQVICPAIPYSRGLLSIAAALIKSNHHVSYVVWSDPEDQLRIKDLARLADVVGITCMTVGHDNAASIANLVRSVNGNAQIILGGPHATALGANLLEEVPAIDAVMRGDGYIAMVEAVEALPNIDGIPGLATRNSPDVDIRTEPYSHSPLPAYQLLYRPLHYYAHSLRTYHGCPYGCVFCVEKETWRVGAFRDLESVYAELSHILSSVSHGTLIHFSDPVFDVDVRRTLSLCNWLTEHAKGTYLSLDTRIDLITQEKVSMLRKSGFRYFRVGIESLVANTLSETRKNTNPDQIRNSLRLIKETAPDALIHGYWITGLPGSTSETAEMSMHDAGKLVNEGHLDILSNKVLVPYPGGEYFTNPLRFGMKILNKPWSAYDRLSPPVFDLETIQTEEIYKWFCKTEAVVSTALEKRLGCKKSGDVRKGIETYKSIAYLGAMSKLRMA